MRYFSRTSHDEGKPHPVESLDALPPSNAATCARPTTAKLEAVRGLNLEIQSGECFGLLGPNGAGKTTTIEILEGLLEPTSGEVSILGPLARE